MTVEGSMKRLLIFVVFVPVCLSGCDLSADLHTMLLDSSGNIRMHAVHGSHASFGTAEIDLLRAQQIFLDQY